MSTVKRESRKYTFTIDTSKDNQTWTQQFDGDSDSGGDTGVETYDFTDVDARFIRINVLGNDKNTFASVTEVMIFGSVIPIGEPLPPIPTPNPSPQFRYNWFRHGYHVNYDIGDVCGGDLGTPTPPTPPTPPSPPPPSPAGPSLSSSEVSNDEDALV